MNSINSTFLYQMMKIRTAALNSEYSFLYPDFIDKEFNEKNKKSAIDILYNEIREGSLGIKIDNLKSLSGIYWNKNDYTGNREEYYYNICRNITDEFFKIRSGQIYIDGNSAPYKNKFDFIYNNKNNLEFGQKNNNKFKWYIIKQLIDLDVLIGVYLIENNLTDKSDIILWNTLIYTTDTLLENELQKGVAELHMHLGASKSFTSIWTSLMSCNNLNNNKIYSKLKANYNYGYIDYEKNMYIFKLMRVLLSLYLNNCDKYEDFQDFICTESEKESYESRFIQKLTKKIIIHIEDDEYTIDSDEKIVAEDVKSSINYLIKTYNLSKNINDDFGDIKKLINNIKEDTIRDKWAAHSKNNIINTILSTDILVSIFDKYYSIIDGNIVLNASKQDIYFPEQVFIFESIKYIKLKKDLWFQRIFWHYVKFKNLVYRQFIQEHTYGNGLDIFKKYYDKQRNVSISNIVYESFYNQIKNQNIKKFEVRMATNLDAEKIVKLLIEIFTRYLAILISGDYLLNSNKSIPLLGIVYHFIKKQEDDSSQCAYDDQKLNKTFCNYNRLQEKYLREAKIINDLRNKIYNLDNYIVGVDAASGENSAEPYMFRKAFEYLRDDKLCKGKNNHYVKQIGFTYHVGEEFRDLLSGFRHIDETIELFEYKAGDRLGHAIALGISVERWTEFNQIVFINASEYLDNLLWQWNLFISEKIELDNIRELEQRIYDTVEYIFGFTDNISIRELYRAYYMKIMGKGCYSDLELLDKENGICKLQAYTKKKYYIRNKCHENNKDKFEKITWNSQMIYKAIKCEYFVRDMNKTVTINVDNDLIETYKKIQEILIQKISHRQIIIETNPTSNLMIGEFKSFEDYYITNLSSPEKEKVIVTINTDDPVVFSTKINNEYALIYDILMKTGKYSGKEVIDWLDRIRLNGLNYSFVEDRNLSRSELIEEVCNIIKELYNYNFLE